MTALHPLARLSLAKLESPLRHVLKPVSDGAAELVFLDGNENAYGGQYCRYPEADPIAVRELFARYLASGLTHEHVWITAGSSEAIDLVLRSFCEPRNDSVCICSPSFPLYQHWACANDLELVDVPLEGERGERLALERIVAAHAKLTFLTSPHNPYGSLLDPRQVIELLERTAGIVAIDEAYIEVTAAASFARLVERFANLIVLRSFSKAWGMAGLRLGAMVAAPGAIEAVRRLAAPYLVSTPALEMLRATLADPSAIEASWQRLRHERERLARRLVELRPVKRVHPSQTHFLRVELDDMPRRVRELLQAGIVIKPLAGALVRVTVGRSEENDRLVEVLARLG
jgi:histidinol-phosphate aminotransferase